MKRHWRTQLREIFQVERKDDPVDLMLLALSRKRPHKFEEQGPAVQERPRRVARRWWTFTPLSLKDYLHDINLYSIDLIISSELREPTKWSGADEYSLHC